MISDFVFLLAFASISAELSIINNEECLHPISWPDPTNYGRYYVCAPILVDCAPGSHYNPQLQQCQDNCQVSTTTVPTTITVPTEAPEPDTTTSSESTGAPEPETTETQETEPTGAPEPEPGPTAVPQPEPTTIISTTTDGRTPAEICGENPHLFFLVAYPGDCTRYIACEFGEAHIIVCPRDTYFHPIVFVCTIDQSVC